MKINYSVWINKINTASHGTMTSGYEDSFVLYDEDLLLRTQHAGFRFTSGFPI